MKPRAIHHILSERDAGWEVKRHLAVRVSTLKRAPAFDEVTTACGRIFSGYDDKKLFERWTRRPESATCLLCKKRVKP